MPDEFDDIMDEPSSAPVKKDEAKDPAVEKAAKPAKPVPVATVNLKEVENRLKAIEENVEKILDILNSEAPSVISDVNDAELGTDVKALLLRAAELSKDSRIEMFIGKYGKGLAEYEKRLGTEDFRKAIGSIMEEAIEGKLIAATRL